MRRISTQACVGARTLMLCGALLAVSFRIDFCLYFISHTHAAAVHPVTFSLQSIR